MPKHDGQIAKYWYSIDWEVETLWALDLPVEQFSIALLKWHMSVPVWPDGTADYSTTPDQVLADPPRHAVEYKRIQQADLDYPIEVYFHHGRWMILDGIHRLAKAIEQGRPMMAVRIIPESEITHILAGN
jgi:hypothetical protein